MSVPYLFATTLGGSGLPLSWLDDNFYYITDGNPTFANLTISGNLTVGGTTTLNGPTIFGDNTLTINGQTANPTGFTGTGLFVLNNTPTLISPLLGTPTSGNLANCVNLPISTGVSGLGANVATFLSVPSSANLLAAMTDETGTGQLVFNTNPTINTPTINSATLTAPILGTPVSGTLTNCTGFPAGNLSGIVPLALGGTGAATQAAALNNLCPPQSAPQAGFVLTTDGAGNITWNVNSSGTVTSITLDPSTTGLTVNGSPAPSTITTSGTFSLGGTLAFANGGTNATTRQGAINNLAGSVASANYLRGNGTNVVMSPLQLADITALGTLNNNINGSSTTFTSTTQNSQFSSVVVSGNVTATTYLSGTTNVASIGLYQSWSNVSAGRSIGGTYNNGTGRPIMVNVGLSYLGATGNCSAAVGGVSVGIASGNATYKNTEQFVFIVPPGDNYSVNGVGVSILFWSELR